MPVRDGEATIAEAVASVLAQTHRNLELIVVDDGSTDGTLAALAPVRDPRLRTVSMPHAGPAASRNRGIERARGELVAFIDADDVWRPEKLEAQLAALARVPDAAVAYCWTDYVDAKGRFASPDGRPTFEGRVHAALLRQNFIDTGSNVLVRREALREVGGFDETLPVVEDWDLSLRLAARFPFACAPAPLVRYRLSENSLTTRVRLMEQSYWRMIDRAFEAAPPELGPLQQQSASLFYQYLTAKATQGCPARRDGLLALRFFASSLRSRPAELFTLHRRPWVAKAVAKACLAVVLPARAMQGLASPMTLRGGGASSPEARA
jgi:glycosyltransferase involved in cell wall biosynthesis